MTRPAVLSVLLSSAAGSISFRNWWLEPEVAFARIPPVADPRSVPVPTVTSKRVWIPNAASKPQVDYKTNKPQPVPPSKGTPVNHGLAPAQAAITKPIQAHAGRPSAAQSSPAAPTVVATAAPTTAKQADATVATVPAQKRYEIREAFKLDLLPFVSIGVKSVRPGPRHDPPPGHRVACPSDRAYCIDFRGSDNGTCMYPDPLEIKRCYDGSCIQSAWGPIVRKQQGEDTYCKDFMTPGGRVCQWLDTVPCTCEAKSIYYYSGEFIPDTEPIPYGFREVHPCTYPLDVLRKAAEDAARIGGKKNRRNRQQGSAGQEAGDDEDNRPRGRQRRYQSDESYSVSAYYLTASLFATIIPIL